MIILQSTTGSKYSKQNAVDVLNPGHAGYLLLMKHIMEKWN